MRSRLQRIQKLQRASPSLVALALACVALGFASWGLLRLNTWYLASDQFAFLTFADDLRSGTVFHDDSALALIQPHPRANWTYDALAQTYYWRDGRLFTRYPPGFPALLALAGAVFGEGGQHALNPVLYLVTLVVLAVLTWTLVRERSEELGLGAAVAAMWLMLLLPTRMHLWGITVARDLPAHLLALLALLAAARRAPVWSAVALGLACTVRPDAAIYLSSVGAIFALVRPAPRRLLMAAAAFAICASPVLVYNFAVEGNPFRFTQGAEFRDLLGALPAEDGIVRVAASILPSGGAFQISNLPTTMPGNAIYLLTAFGWFSGFVVFAVGWGLRHQRLLVAALVPYAVVAFVFYSCWSHPDARYLAGVAACLVPLAAVGAVVVCTGVARAGAVGRLLALLLAAVPLARALGVAPGLIPAPGRAGVVTAIAIVVLAVFGWLPGLATRRSRLGALAPAIAFGVLGIVLVVRSRGARDPFQYPQVERAREVVREMMPAGSLVVTTTTLGRPAENLRHYSDVEAFYAEELPLLRINADVAMVYFALDGRRVFYLLDARDRERLSRVSRGAEVRRVEHRQGADLLEWYVDPRRAPAGAVLYELTLSEARAEEVRLLLDLLERGRPEPEPGFGPQS